MRVLMKLKSVEISSKTSSNIRVPTTWEPLPSEPTKGFKAASWLTLGCDDAWVKRALDEMFTF